VPAEGVLAGIDLPPGRAQGEDGSAHFWCSDQPVEDVESMATWLAQVFARTGLWSLVWMWDDEDAPGSYFGRAPDLRYLGESSAEDVVAAGWQGVDASSLRSERFPAWWPQRRDAYRARRSRNPFLGVGGLVAYWDR
jgi:hypothetical protein